MTATMRAAVLESPKKLVVREVPVFAPGPDEVQIQVKACGICGSDLRYFQGENPWALHTLGRHVDNPPNIILGHEFCGVVTEVGSRENESFLGSRVVVAPYKPCGRCDDCRSGNYHLCRYTRHIGHAAGWGKQPIYPGGMAEYCPVWTTQCYKLPESISDSEATFLDIAGVGVHALNRAGPMPGRSVLVIGCGPLGFSILALSPYWGAVRRFATETKAKAREIISSQGVTAFSGLETELDEKIFGLTDGRGVNLVFDTVGIRETQNLGRKVLAPRGIMVNLAIHHKKVSFFMDELGKERSIQSSCNYLFPEFKMVIDLTASGKIDLKPYITHKLPLAQAPEAFALASDRTTSGALKVVLKPG